MTYWNYIIRFHRTFIAFLLDLGSILMSMLIVIAINYEYSIRTFSDKSHLNVGLVLVLCVQALSNINFGLYRGAWRFASIPDLIRIIQASFVSTIILYILNIYLNKQILPISTFILFMLLAVTGLSGTRLTYRWLKDSKKLFRDGKKVIVIGAGSAGEGLIRELKRKKNKDLQVIGLIDDDLSKKGMEIHGVRVLGSTADLKNLVNNDVDLVLIAIPGASPSEMRRIVKLCQESNIPYRTLPSLKDITSGKSHITNIRKVTVEDLLGRDPIQFDHGEIENYIKNKTVFITGAGGSIGAELCRKLAKSIPASLILVDLCEYNLFKIHSELIGLFPHLKIYFYLVSVTNQEIINKIMKTHTPHFVFHAAAYKHVPLLEPQVRVAIENNIFGTQIVAEAAKSNNVEKFILVSTDKAVNPSNIMGATKRAAELLCQSLNQNSSTRFITVRFGNVLGSTGSVIPIFEEQIAKGGPVTVTHPDIQRYFMTISEAAQLIIQTVLDNSSDLYVLDMGEPINIQYLAEQMIKLSGHVPNIEINIVHTGLRPGEKMNEELFYDKENVERINQGKILRVKTNRIDPQNFMFHFNELKHSCMSNSENLKKNLFKLVNSANSTPTANKSKIPTSQIDDTEVEVLEYI